MSERVASPNLVGRRQELRRLVDGVNAAAEGTPGFFLVGGESGVGKSRLVRELADRAAGDGARVLSGDCIELGDAVAYAPLVGALRDVSAAELEALLGAHAPELAPLLPQLDAPGAAPAASSLAQGRLFELLLALLAGLGEQAPLVLVVEDMHWADRSTRDFLSFLIRNARRERLLVVATYRTDELHRRHPLRAFLAEADRASGVGRLTLERFTRDELQEQLTGILGHRPPPRLVDEVFGRAEGNPFFTEELVAASAGTLHAPLPDDVRDALILRIEALSGDTQAALRVAAAAGARVRHTLLARVAGLPEDALNAALREAVAHHVLIHEPSTDAYIFRHALLREAIVDDLLPGERGPLHAALGRALADDPSLSASGRGVAAELAFHWSAAHDLAAALTASAQAGAEAEQIAAFAEANAHFERAAELWDAVPEDRRPPGLTRLEVLRRAAEAARLYGDHDRALALLRSGLALVDPAADPMTAAILHERLGRYLWLSGLAPDALDALGTAVALMPADAPAEERARVLGAQGQLLMVLGRSAEARDRCTAALTLARAAGARGEEARILNSLGAAVIMTPEYEEGIAGMRTALQIAEELGDLEEVIRSFVNLGEALDQRGRIAEAAAVAREGVAVARREGIRAAIPMLLAELAARQVRLGDWNEAAAALDEALDAPQAWGAGRAMALTGRAQVDALRGEAELAEQRLAEADREQPHAIGSMWTAPITAVRAEISLWSGTPAAAREAVDRELAERDTDDEPAAFYLAPVIAAGARAEADLAARARATGDHAGEADALDRAARLCATGHELLASETLPEATLHIATAEAEHERARGTAVPATWAALAERWSAFGMPFQAAYAAWRQAETALAAGGAKGDAARVLLDVHATAARLGAGPLRAEAEDLARRARIPLDGTPAAVEAPAGADADGSAAQRVGLTARELDVLRLLASGATNREIGESLFISQKTVSVHVSRILSKLDARTRVEAAGLAHRLRLLTDDAIG